MEDEFDRITAEIRETDNNPISRKIDAIIRYTLCGIGLAFLVFMLYKEYM